MLGRFFPPQIDNCYRGRRAGLWLFAAYVLLKLAMSANSILNPRTVATGGDGFPLDRYGAGAAQAVLMLFAIVGLGQLALAALGVLALVRYRAMIPLLYLLLLVEHSGRRLLVRAWAVERSEAMPVGAYLNLGLLALLIAGLALSLARPRASQ